MKRLRWVDYITLNVFWLGLNIRNTAISSIFMPYMVDLYAPGVKNTALGVMRTAGLVVALLVQPAAGLLSDRSTSRFGRRRPYILVGVWLDLLFLAAIGLSWDYWSLLVAVLLVQFSSNVSHGPLQGLIPDLVPEEQRGRASAVKAIMELLPLILVGMTIAPLVGRGQLGWAIAATGAALVVTMVLTLVFVREQPLRQKPVGGIGRPMVRVLGILGGVVAGAVVGLAGGALVGGLVGLIAWPLAGVAAARAIGVGSGGAVSMVVAVIAGVWAGAWTTLGRDGLRHRSFVWWVVNRLLFLSAVSSIQAFVPYFLMHTFAVTRETAASMTGSLITMVGVFTLLSALPAGWLADRFGHRRLVSLSGWLAAFGGMLLLGTIWLPNLALIYVVGAIIGLAAGLFMTTNWALGTDLVPPDEAGRYLGISNLAGAGAGMVGTGIGGPVADALNAFRPGMGYFAIFAAYALLFALSAVSLHWVRAEVAAPAGQAPPG